MLLAAPATDVVDGGAAVVVYYGIEQSVQERGEAERGGDAEIGADVAEAAADGAAARLGDQVAEAGQEVGIERIRYAAQPDVAPGRARVTVARSGGGFGRLGGGVCARFRGVGGEVDARRRDGEVAAAGGALDQYEVECGGARIPQRIWARMTAVRLVPKCLAMRWEPGAAARRSKVSARCRP